MDKLPREAPEGRDDYRARVLRNSVHHNFNEIYSWVGTKGFVHAKIDEGKGISLQRNQKFNSGGRILVANNIAYWNGYSGIHSNDGDNVDFFSNTAYLNSYTNTITYASKGADRGGNNIGLSLSNGKNCRIINNVAYIDTSWMGMPISVTGIKDPVYHNNVAYGKDLTDGASSTLKSDHDFASVATNTLETDPRLLDTTEDDGWHFIPAPDSPLVGIADKSWSPCEDFYSSSRSRAKPSVGAVELNCVPQTTASKDIGACYAIGGNANSEAATTNSESCVSPPPTSSDPKDPTDYPLSDVNDTLPSTETSSTPWISPFRNTGPEPETSDDNVEPESRNEARSAAEAASKAERDRNREEAQVAKDQQAKVKAKAEEEKKKAAEEKRAAAQAAREKRQAEAKARAEERKKAAEEKRKARNKAQALGTAMLGEARRGEIVTGTLNDVLNGGVSDIAAFVAAAAAAFVIVAVAAVLRQRSTDHFTSGNPDDEHVRLTGSISSSNDCAYGAV